MRDPDEITLDEALLRRAFGGDSQAGEDLWLTVRSLVHRFAVGLCRKKFVSQNDVEDRANENP